MDDELAFGSEVVVSLTCQTAKRNPPRPSVGPAVAVVFPALAGGPLPSKAEGAERRVAPPDTFHALRRARPLAKGRCALRRSARRFSVSGSHFALTARSSIGARNAGRHCIATVLARGHSAPGAGPRAARAPCLRGTKAQAPHPAPPWMPPEAPSNERGCRNIYLRNIVMSSGATIETLCRAFC